MSHAEESAYVERPDDVNDIRAFLKKLDTVDSARMMLMPQAADRQRYRRLAPKVAQWALQAGWRFSPRLQVELGEG